MWAGSTIAQLMHAHGLHAGTRHDRHLKNEIGQQMTSAHLVTLCCHSVALRTGMLHAQAAVEDGAVQRAAGHPSRRVWQEGFQQLLSAASVTEWQSGWVRRVRGLSRTNAVALWEGLVEWCKAAAHIQPTRNQISTRFATCVEAHMATAAQCHAVTAKVLYVQPSHCIKKQQTLSLADEKQRDTPHTKN